MRFALIHKAASYLMVGAGFSAAYFGGEVHTAVGVVFLCALIASWFWEPPRVDRDPLVRYWNVATVVVFVLSVAAVVVYDGDVILSAFHFLAFLQLNKLFNRRISKDYLHAYVLSFLMLTLATTMNTELNYGVWFILYLVFTTWTLILFHLKREMEDNYLLKHSEDASRSRKVEIQRILNSRRIVGVPFLAATSGISVAAFLLSATLFFLFPRVGFGLFFANRRAGATIAGFSERVELGTFGLIRDNPSVVMRVEMKGADSLRVQGLLRWRGATYDTYDGRRWSRSSKRRRGLYKYEGSFYFRRPGVEAVRQDIYLEPLDTRLLFALDRPSRVEVHDGPRDLPQGAVYEARANDYDDVLLTVSSTLSGTRVARWTDPDRFVSNPAVHYTAWSDVDRPRDADLAADVLPYAPELLAELAPFLQRPQGLDPKVEELARRVVGRHSTVVGQARALEKHLRADYGYTTQLDRDERLAPLEDFLFVQRKGHCEYFATAMVVMLRSLGVPARYVSGFYGGHWNRFGQYLAVSHGDAHSWVEVFFPAQGRWFAFDPTPAGTGADRRRAGAYWTMLMYVDSLRLKWYRYVVEYDLNEQFQAVGRLRGWLPELFEQGGAAVPGVPSVRRVVRERRGMLVGLGVVASVAIGLVVVLLRRRRRVRGRRVSASIHRSTQLYLLLLRHLARRGHTKRPADTALEFQRLVEGGGTPDEVAVVREVTGRYLATRFGGAPLPPADAGRLAERVRALGRSA